MNENKMILIDGNGLLEEAFFSLPQHCAEGLSVLLAKTLRGERAGKAAAVLDLEKEKGLCPHLQEELSRQGGILKERLLSMRIPFLIAAEGEGASSAELLASAARQYGQDGDEVVILSAGKRFLPLITEQVTVKIPAVEEGELQFSAYSLERMKEEYDLEPKALKNVLALTFEGVKPPAGWGIGERTASNLIRRYQTIENLYKHIEEIPSLRIKEALLAGKQEVELAEKNGEWKDDWTIEFHLEEGNAAEEESEWETVSGEDCTPFSGEAFLEEGKESAGTGFSGSFAELFFPVRGISEEGNFGGENPFEEETPACPNFTVIETTAQAEAIFSQAQGRNLGLELAAEEKAASLAALSLCFGEKDCYCFLPGEEFTPKYLCEQAEKLLKSAGQATVFHLKKQLSFLNLSAESGVFDAGVAAYLLNPLKESYEYQDLATDYLGLGLPSKEELFGKSSIESAFKEKREEAVSWACYTAYTAFSCGDKLREELRNLGMERLFDEVEMPLVYSLFQMEKTGIMVERQQLKEYGDRLKVGILELEKKIHEETGEQFNINSPKQLGEVLFDHMKLSGGKKTKTGYSTAADVLEKLAADVPAARMVLDYRQLTKLNSTYADGLAAYIGPDKRIHGSFNQTITATGRISSTEPNLQNIPVRMDLGREIRKVFVPKEGCVFVDADYSQIELRVLAHMSGDQRLIKAYRQAEDIHAITASQVFHIPLNEVTSLQRRNAKAVNFGIVYGISSFGLS